MAFDAITRQAGEHMNKDLMTTEDVRAMFDYATRQVALAWCHRHGVKPLYKQPGHKGMNVYRRADVLAGKDRMPGRGAGGGRKLR